MALDSESQSFFSFLICVQSSKDGRPENGCTAASTRLDRNAFAADIDLKTARLVPLLVQLIAKYKEDDGECDGDEVNGIESH
jgi:hypothetical protein